MVSFVAVALVILALLLFFGLLCLLPMLVCCAQSLGFCCAYVGALSGSGVVVGVVLIGVGVADCCVPQ